MIDTLIGSLLITIGHQESMEWSASLPQVHMISEAHQPIVQGQPSVHKNLRTISEVTHGDKYKPLIALTFDDGFDPAVSQQMIDTLKAKRVLATFFLKGNWMTEEPIITQTIINDGHEIGNHSYDHPQFTKLTTFQIKQEIQDQENVLVRNHQYSPHPYFRFPYGARNPKIMKMINALGYTSIMWDIDTLDWATDKETIVKETLTNAHNGAIILMHLGKSASAEALPEIIDGLRAKGFELVTISTLIDNDDAISP